jgi:hypothetical protein
MYKPLLRGVLVPGKDSSRGPAMRGLTFPMRCLRFLLLLLVPCGLCSAALSHLRWFAHTQMCSKFELAFYRSLVELPCLFDPQTHHVNTKKEVPQWRSDPMSFVVSEKYNL